MAIRTILYVDDDADDHDLFSQIVYSIDPDIKLIHANDSCQIDDYLKEPLPDIIILDMNMPRMDGLECLKRIRADNTFKKIPIVMYSVVNYKANEAYELGANYFMIKHSTLDDIKEDIKHLLNRSWNNDNT